MDDGDQLESSQRLQQPRQTRQSDVATRADIARLDWRDDHILAMVEERLSPETLKKVVAEILKTMGKVPETAPATSADVPPERRLHGQNKPPTSTNATSENRLTAVEEDPIDHKSALKAIPANEKESDALEKANAEIETLKKLLSSTKAENARLKRGLAAADYPPLSPLSRRFPSHSQTQRSPLSQIPMFPAPTEQPQFLTPSQSETLSQSTNSTRTPARQIHLSPCTGQMGLPWRRQASVGTSSLSQVDTAGPSQVGSFEVGPSQDERSEMEEEQKLSRARSRVKEEDYFSISPAERGYGSCGIDAHLAREKVCRTS